VANAIIQNLKGRKLKKRRKSKRNNFDYNLGAVSIKFSPPFLVYLDYIITLGDSSSQSKKIT